MARDEGEPQAMTAERLAEITRRLNEAAGMPAEATTQIERDVLALLAEVERQRAENVRANDLIESVAEGEMQLGNRITALEADNERLRAREAALLAVVEDVARAFNLRSVIVVGREEPHVVATLSRNAIEQARALLSELQEGEATHDAE